MNSRRLNVLAAGPRTASHPTQNGPSGQGVCDLLRGTSKEPRNVSSWQILLQKSVEARDRGREVTSVRQNVLA